MATSVQLLDVMHARMIVQAVLVTVLVVAAIFVIMVAKVVATLNV